MIVKEKSGIPDAAAAGGQIVRPLGIYLHIPFCVRKCAYCDFLSFPAAEDIRASYTEALVRQIRSMETVFRQYRAVSLFFGGGTPSLLTGNQTEKIMQAVHDAVSVAKDAEMTIECNPGTVNPETLHIWKELGINRLSFGVQASQNELLRVLGRIHTWEAFLESWKLAQQAGFDNCSVDLMSGLPGQTPEMWKETLRKAAQLGPKHISAYGLIIEEGTPFWDRYREDEARRDRGEMPQLLPDEEADRDMYRCTKELLGEYGYERYEISNYACPGYESRHNTGYWKRKEYIGLGLGASSQTGPYRFRCTASLQQYMDVFGKNGPMPHIPMQNGPEESAVYEEVQKLSEREQIEETMFLGMRMTEGVSFAEFRSLYGMEIDSLYGEVNRRLEQAGLVGRSDTHLFLAEKGIDISNAVLAEYLLE